ncbi:cytochrome P450 [Solwaraspora sp. WMMB335]|uniref:cytochrome P450 n=1 Tax=Solwaraspora sp. WMMB335 TaxID=3404118 RepID=UPI003B93059F
MTGQDPARPGLAPARPVPTRDHRRAVRVRLAALRADLLGTQRRLARTPGGVVRFRVLHRAFTLVASAPAIQHVLVANAPAYRRSRQHDNLALTIGYGLICSDGAVWRRQRRLAQPIFNRELLARVVDVTAGRTEELLDRWERAREHGEPVEIVAQMRELTMGVIAQALFGEDLPAPANVFTDTVDVALEVAIRRNILPVTLPVWVPTRLHRRLRRCRRAVDRYVYQRIDERLRDDDGRQDILAALIRGYGDQACRSRRELRDQVVTLFFAGFETTATALAWTWLLLDREEAVADRLHVELAQVLGGRAPTVEDLAALPYTHQILQESMRIYPPVYTLTRRAAVADRIDGVDVRRGDSVILPIHAAQCSAVLWDAPDEFRPQRFAPGRLTRAQRHAYAPFGAGARKCLGAGFATVEMATVLAVVAQRVRLRLIEGHPVAVSATVTQYPTHGLAMRVERAAAGDRS